MARGKAPAAALKPPRPLKVSKDFKKNNSGTFDIVPADPPRNLTFNGARAQSLPYDYLQGVQSMQPMVSVLPPAYFSAYTSMLGNRSAMYRDFASQVKRDQAEAAYVSRQLDTLQGLPKNKAVPGLNIPKLKTFAAEAGNPIPDSEFAALEGRADTALPTDAEMQQAEMYVPDMVNRPGFMENVEANQNEREMQDVPPSRTVSNATDMAGVENEEDGDDFFLPMPPQLPDQGTQLPPQEPMETQPTTQDSGTQANDVFSRLKELSDAGTEAYQDAQVAALEQEVATLRTEYDTAVRDGTASRTELEDMRRLLQDTQAEVVRLQQENAMQSREIDSANRYMEQVTLMERDLDSAERYTKQLEETIQELETKLQEQGARNKRRRGKRGETEDEPGAKVPRGPRRLEKPTSDAIDNLARDMQNSRDRTEANARFDAFLGEVNDRGYEVDMSLDQLIRVSIARELASIRGTKEALERELVTAAPARRAEITRELQLLRLTGPDGPRLTS